VWWLRVSALDEARVRRQAFALVEERGLDKADAETRRHYNDLILELRGG
jgi:hypothetical protein